MSMIDVSINLGIILAIFKWIADFFCTACVLQQQKNTRVNKYEKFVVFCFETVFPVFCFQSLPPTHIHTRTQV